VSAQTLGGCAGAELIPYGREFARRLVVDRRLPQRLLGEGRLPLAVQIDAILFHDWRLNRRRAQSFLAPCPILLPALAFTKLAFLFILPMR